ncbi:hypothetical protein Y1Q_0001939 [Alligator mississippiensis]|uniref:Uncharacterized protein n=1 Tax=Alligator mississippiensis TaxID=8496 RepID=A0A151PH84_ALLMI|nr:hypothetical protein Y1Q_0001939 [Alligator mississippiensis]
MGAPRRCQTSYLSGERKGDGQKDPQDMCLKGTGENGTTATFSPELHACLLCSPALHTSPFHTPNDSACSAETGAQRSLLTTQHAFLYLQQSLLSQEAAVSYLVPKSYT